jgi:hypothetical protein
LSPVGINATVVPPSPPPVNPAPPSGSAARKEAKQRQAATAKSEEDASAGHQTQQAGGDLAGDRNAPLAARRNEMAMTRRDPTRIAPSFTAVTHHEQASAWSRDLLLGGGLASTALVLALGFSTVRPGSRRREPHLPAAEQARLR